MLRDPNRDPDQDLPPTAPLNPEDERVARIKTLLNQYRQTRDAAQTKLESLSPVGQEDVDAALSTRSDRSFGSSLLNAANKIGNVQGEAVKSGFGDYAAEQNAIDSDALKSRQGIYDKALQAAQQANENMSATDDRLNAAQRQGVSDARATEQWNRESADYNASQATKTQESDPTSQISLQYQTLAKKLMPNGKFDGMSAAQLKQGLPVLEKVYGIDQATQARRDAAAASAQARKDAQTARAEEKATVRGNKEADESKKKEEALKAKQQEVDYRVSTLNNNLNQLENIVNEYGTVELLGPQSAQMDGLIYQVAVDFAKLVDPTSVAREGEVAAAQKYMLPVKGFGTKNSTAIQLIKQMKQSVAQRRDEYKNSFAKGQADPADARKVSSASPAPHGQQVQQDGKTYNWNGSEYVEGGQ